jgi:hypothetical protein
VHQAVSVGGLCVVSVIADPARAPAEVLAAAHTVIAGLAGWSWHQVPGARQHRLADLPLGEGHSWTISETENETGQEHYDCVLPAWTAASHFDLSTRPNSGYPQVTEALGELLPDDLISAEQVAQANYHRTGFDAAAITSIMAGWGGPARRSRTRRADVRFGHPYAVIAVPGPTPHLPGRPLPSTHGQSWIGIPVFSAWITTPTEADTAPPER